MNEVSDDGHHLDYTRRNPVAFPGLPRLFGFVAYKMTKPERFVGDWTPKDLGFDYENVEFTTEEGLKLRAGG